MISPPRVRRKKDGTTRYEKEIAGSPKLADDPTERKWVGSWLMGETIGKGASGAWDSIQLGLFIASKTVSEFPGPGFSFLGRVRLAKNKHTGKVAAVKIVPKLRLGGRIDPKAEKVMQSIRREMVVLKLIHHPHIMDMYDVYEDEEEL